MISPESYNCDRDEVFIEIIEILASKGDVRALEVVKLIFCESLQKTMLGCVYGDLTKHGYVDIAVNLAMQADDLGKIRAFKKIYKNLINDYKVEIAVEIAQRNIIDRDLSLKFISKFLFHKEYSDLVSYKKYYIKVDTAFGSIGIASAISNEGIKREVLGLINSGIASLTLHRHGKDHDLKTALRIYSTRLAEKGEFERACRWAEWITDEVEKKYVFKRIYLHQVIFDEGEKALNFSKMILSEYEKEGFIDEILRILFDNENFAKIMDIVSSLPGSSSKDRILMKVIENFVRKREKNGNVDFVIKKPSFVNTIISEISDIHTNTYAKELLHFKLN